MRVLYVQEYLGRKEWPVLPIGLLYIATAASEHEARLFDMNLSEDPYGELERIIKEYDPHVVALSLRNIDNQQRANLFYYYLFFPKTLRSIKAAKPSVKLVVGGSGFSMFPETIMKRYSEIDYGVYLEGEIAFPALLKNLDSPSLAPSVYYREGDQLKFSGQGPLLDLDEVPIPRKDIVPDMKAYFAGKGGVGINTKRGCPYRCAYCNYFALNGSLVRLRKPASIVDEIEELVKDYGLEEFLFADGVFSAPFEHVKAICDELKRLCLKVRWSAWCDTKDITEEFLDTVTSAGCDHIIISPDAYSEGALRGLNKGVTTSEVRQAIDLICRYPGIKIGFGFFMTAPGETCAGYFRTLFYYLATAARLVLKRKGGCGLSWIRIEPETRMREIAVSEGLIDEHDDLLPEDLAGLRKLFYVNPKLRLVDPVSRLLVGTADMARKLLRPLRHGRRKE